MNRYRKYNPNPLGKNVGDCTVRAIAKVTGLPWYKAYLWLCVYGFMLCDMPSANAVWGTFLRHRGFRKRIIDRDEHYTIEKFCEEHPTGVFAVALSGHVVACVCGCVYDTWNSSQEVPIYYWEKER